MWPASMRRTLLRQLFSMPFSIHTRRCAQDSLGWGWGKSPKHKEVPGVVGKKQIIVETLHQANFEERRCCLTHSTPKRWVGEEEDG